MAAAHHRRLARLAAQVQLPGPSRGYAPAEPPVAAAAGSGVRSSSSAAGVGGGTAEILWDTYGVPHIYAPDHASLFHAYGWAQMEAHSELLLQLYAESQGRGCEFYGRGADGGDGSSSQRLEGDIWVRTHGTAALGKRWAAGQSTGFAPLIDAFAAGINDWGAPSLLACRVRARGVLGEPAAKLLMGDRRV
jgi:acyl-homoserine lactone acylase PvdQ